MLSVQIYKNYLWQTVSVGRRRFSADFQLVFRLIKGMIFLTFVAILVTLIALPHMTLQDIVVCVLAFMPTGWGMLLVSKSIDLRMFAIAFINRTVGFVILIFIHFFFLLGHCFPDRTGMQAISGESWVLGICTNTGSRV